MIFYVGCKFNLRQSTFVAIPYLLGAFLDALFNQTKLTFIKTS